METNALETPEIVEANDLNEIKRKQHFTGVVVKTTLAGAVVNIGLEVPGVVHISQIQSGPVNRVEDVVQPGQTVDVWVRRVVPKKKRIELTMVKPLELEWKEIEPEMVLKGKVTRLEKFGAFVEIGAERPGLVHISEMTHDYIKTPSEVVKEGDEVDVKVLNVDRQKKQIKLSMKALEEPPAKIIQEIQQRPAQQRPAQRKPADAQAHKPAEEPEVKEPAVPTAMEVALRNAMERSQEQLPEDTSDKGKKKKPSKNDLENILMRTLQNKRK